MKKLGTKIKKVKKVDSENFIIRLEYTDGFLGDVSLARFFEQPKGLATEILRGNLFDKCFIEMGALAWPNGLEFCPDAIREWIREQEGERAA